MSSTATPPEALAKLTKSGNIRLEGALCVQNGTPMFTSFSNAEDVVRQARVDTLDPKTKKGYQRLASTARIKAAARYYAGGGRMPNPLLMNIREDDFDRVNVVITSTNRDGYDQAVNDSGNWIGTGYIEFPTDLPIWLYDGQHREGGLEQNLAEHLGFNDFPVPISVCLGLAEPEEMTEFYEVNTNAKSVPTDLAWELLRQMAEDNPEIRAMLEDAEKDWIVRGIDVIRELERIDGPWKGRVLPPNQKKARNDGTAIPQAQLARSLKPVLDMPLLKRAEIHQIATIINAYWQGIAEVLPEPFAPGSNPGEWVIQKGPGATALHRILPQVIEVVRAKGKPLGDSSSYAEVMEQLPTLAGDMVTDDGEFVQTSGADFWKVGSAASAFTGDSGRKRLALRIQTVIPKPTDEINL